MIHINKIYLLLVFLLIIPIVKADGCGITCPTAENKASFFSRLICGFGTWAFCNPLSWVIFIIIIVVAYFYWKGLEEESRGKIKTYATIIFIILLLVIFYPSIKALLFTSPFIETVTTTTIQAYFSCDDPCISDVRCVLACTNSPPFFHTNATDRHTSTEEYYDLAIFPGDPANQTLYLYSGGSVDYDMMVIWNDTGTCNVPNATYNACYPNLGLGFNEACTGSISVGEKGKVTIEYINGTGNYDLSYNCTA